MKAAPPSVELKKKTAKLPRREKKPATGGDSPPPAGKGDIVMSIRTPGDVWTQIDDELEDGQTRSDFVLKAVRRAFKQGGTMRVVAIQPDTLQILEDVAAGSGLTVDDLINEAVRSSRGKLYGLAEDRQGTEEMTAGQKRREYEAKRKACAENENHKGDHGNNHREDNGRTPAP